MDNLSRLHALSSYQIMDTLPQADFDEITEMAAAICGTPISLITFLDSDRQWFKSKVGLDISQTPLGQSFCNHAVQTPDQLLIVEDSALDDRFKDNPLATGEPYVKFYAGAPLVTPEGIALGSLCVIDHVARSLTNQQQSALALLSKRVIKQLEFRKAHIESEKLHRASNQRLFAVAEQSPDFIAVVDDSLTISYVNRSYDGISREQFLGMRIPEMILPEYQRVFIEHCQIVFQTEQPQRLDIEIEKRDGSFMWVSCRIAPLRDEVGKVHDIILVCRDISIRIAAEKNNLKHIESLEKMMFMISHQLRSPICSMLGIAPLLNQQDTSLEEKLQCFEHIHDSVLKMDDYVRELSLYVETLRSQRRLGEDAA
ncbi:PAS domain-containing protein [Dyadobacter crusticola]|uniref:PAS domain-containing protein n=1 Tax=Dyadobacter crusticola TaxID=292407 RepID=UPI00069079EE|nr:PAS domain-containing protein [Dyadobacter crusticola]